MKDNNPAIKINTTVRLFAAAIIFLLLVSCGCGRQEIVLSGKNIVTKHGMVVSAHPEASRIGAGILLKGGNAVDAAVATGFALAVCFPEAGNIGGGGFMLIRQADGSCNVIDYREKAPALASEKMFLGTDGIVTPGLSTDTHLGCGVPGSVDGMINAHTEYGSLPLKDLIQPAIDLAEKGFPVTPSQASDLNVIRETLVKHNAFRPALVKDSLWKEGDTLVQRDLAMTLKKIRDYGRDGFYSGEVAGMILGEMKKGNGIISREDLLSYRSVPRKPLKVKYKGYGIITVPPPSGGGILLIQLLKMTESYPVKQWGFNSFKTIHLVAEAERRAFADRSQHVGDPDYMKVTAEQLIDSIYIISRMHTFDETKASSSEEIQGGNPEGYVSEETTHYSVVDALGNAVSVTTTLNGTFGSGIVVEGAGFLLNNQMDDFAIKPGFPSMYGLTGSEVNSISPGKKILSSMTPVIVEKEGKLFIIAGTPGGATIPTTVYQILTNVIDHGMTIHEAVDASRFHHQWLPDWISYEKGRFDSTSMMKLRQLGHQLKPRSSIGSANAIMILGDGTKAGGADRRGDNCSAGY